MSEKDHRKQHPDQAARMEMLNRSTGKELKLTVETVHGVKESVTTTSYPENMTIDDSSVHYSTCSIYSYAELYVNKIVQWHHDRNLIEGSSDKDQFCKLMQEAGELSDNICKGKDVSDDIGDMIVVLLNIAERNGLSLRDCLAKAWDDIKDRKGRMVDGIFVKEGD